MLFFFRHFLSSPRCKEIVIIQIKDRPGFEMFLLRLESLGLAYNISNLDHTTQRIAAGIQVRSVAGVDGGAKVFTFPIPADALLRSQASACIDREVVTSAQADAELVNMSGIGCINDADDENVISARTGASILSTDPNMFAVLRISRGSLP